MPTDARPPLADPVPTASGWIFQPQPHVCAVTDRGCVRTHNEDTFFVSADGRLVIVADGMGGHAAGEVASTLAAQTVRDFVNEKLARTEKPSPAFVAEILTAALRAANARVFETAAADADLRTMGTTFVAAFVGDSWVCTAHVGDVRAYVIDERDCRQVTRDQSSVGLMVEAGTITAAEARHHPRRSEVLQAIGSSLEVRPDVAVHPLPSGSRLLLCSDGLWEPVTDEQIAETLRSAPALDARVLELIELAIRAGGRDNITAVVYENPSESA